MSSSEYRMMGVGDGASISSGYAVLYTSHEELRASLYKRICSIPHLNIVKGTLHWEVHARGPSTWIDEVRSVRNYCLIANHTSRQGMRWTTDYDVSSRIVPQVFTDDQVGL